MESVVLQLLVLCQSISAITMVAEAGLRKCFEMSGFLSL